MCEGLAPALLLAVVAARMRSPHPPRRPCSSARWTRRRSWWGTGWTTTCAPSRSSTQGQQRLSRGPAGQRPRPSGTSCRLCPVHSVAAPVCEAASAVEGWGGVPAALPLKATTAPAPAAHSLRTLRAMRRPDHAPPFGPHSPPLGHGRAQLITTIIAPPPLPGCWTPRCCTRTRAARPPRARCACCASAGSAAPSRTARTTAWRTRAPRWTWSS